MFPFDQLEKALHPINPLVMYFVGPIIIVPLVFCCCLKFCDLDNKLNRKKIYSEQSVIHIQSDRVPD